MPVLLLFLLIAAAAFYWHARRSARTRDAARTERRVTERLSDPREAAAILLVQQAAYEGHVGADQRSAILSLMTANFGVTGAEAEDLYAFARMAVDQTGDAGNSLRRLLQPVRDRCTLAEMKDLAAMLVQVGETGGPMNDRQDRLVADVRRALSLPARDQESS